MSRTLSKVAELAVTGILAILRQLPESQRRKVLDAAKEREAFDRVGDAKLAARRARRKVIK